jgi:ATP adenylyltransferase/5',5'''-P-1,P-4-tetraphosphate phosphorylase II
MLTKEWMFIVLRKQPEIQGLNVNSLGYLGMLYAHNEEQAKVIAEKKPMEILNTLAIPIYENS